MDKCVECSAELTLQEAEEGDTCHDCIDASITDEDLQ